jgi:hypothetical protein
VKREREESLEDRSVRRAEEVGALALKLIPIGFRGFPDRTILWMGRVAFVEFKRPDGSGKVAAQQSRWHDMLRRAGFLVYLVETDDEFTGILNLMELGR